MQYGADCSTSVVETHPESLIDLRVHAPFPELIEYAATFDYSKMDSAEHSHVPAVVILVKAIQAWRQSVGLSSFGLDRSSLVHLQHDGRRPSTTAERKEFVSTVMAGKKGQDEENFDEAVTYFRRAGTKSGVSCSASPGEKHGRGLIVCSSKNIGPRRYQAIIRGPLLPSSVCRGQSTDVRR